MDRRLPLISGLPRSGPTLLSALLRQSPRFHAGMSGPLCGLFGAMRAEMSERSEFSVFLDDDKRRRHVPWIVDSIEQLVQCNAFRLSAMFNFNAGGTVHSRANTLASADGMLGLADDSPEADDPAAGPVPALRA